MNGERLLANFDRLAEAPDAIHRLRRFVLDLAVRGKLAEQDPEDEPAVELLKRIALEKTRLWKAGKIRKPRTVAPLGPDELPFRLSAGWQWTQMAHLGVINPRNEAPDDHEASFVPMRAIAADYGASHEYEPRLWGEIKKCYTHFAEGDVGLAKITPCFENGKSTVFRNLTGGIGSGTTELHIVRPLFVLADYIVLFLKTPHFIETGIPKMTGTAGQKRVPSEYFTSSPFPLPPLTEQHRIVSKVDELMALCDQLEEARAARESIRSRVTDATLAHLSAHEVQAETLRSNARFAIDAFPALTARTNQVKFFRHALLDLAMRGKLAKQDPADEPVSELLRRIEAEKTKASKTKKRQSYPLNAYAIDENLFDLPAGWKWVPLARISDVTMGQSPPGETYNKSGDGVPLINGPVEFTPGPFGRTIVNQFTTAPKKYCEEGDLLICVRGSTTGRTNVAAFRACIGRGVAAIRSSFDDQFIRLVLWNARKDIMSMGRGIAFPSISRKQLETFPIPLPPLAEQHRIAIKVEGLMTLCDRLETNLGTVNANGNRLLESILQEALRDAA